MGKKIRAEPAAAKYNYVDALTIGLLQPKPSQQAHHKKHILYLKFGVFFGIVLVAAVIGYIAYAVVRDSERKQFSQSYNNLIDAVIPSINIGRRTLSCCCIPSMFCLSANGVSTLIWQELTQPVTL